MDFAQLVFPIWNKARPRHASPGQASEELDTCLAAPQAVPIVSLLFFSNVVRILVLDETPHDIPSQAPVLRLAYYGKPFFLC